MRNLLNFIARHHFFFLFLALQIIAFIILIQNSYYHRSFWINSVNYITGQLYHKYTDVGEYFYLKKINERLAEENQNLINQTPYSFMKTDEQIFFFRDTIYNRQYSYVSARVINNSVNRRNNYLTLNKGRLHGIEPDMGVITSQGVIGIVKNVSANFSSVLSLLHVDTRISAKIMKNGHLGTILWDAPNYRKVAMKHVPPHVEIQPGDTIITSGYSKIFPEDILIGTVSDFDIKRGESFITIQVDLLEDFNNLTYVHVVKNLYRQEQMDIEYHSRTKPMYW